MTEQHRMTLCSSQIRKMNIYPDLNYMAELTI